MIERLVAWAVAAGAYVEPIEIRVDAAGSRGLFARRAVRDGELLLRIPAHLVVTHEMLAATELGGAVAEIEGKLHSRYVLPGIWLAAERMEAASPWRPYLDALPADLSYMATLRSDEELVGLEGTRAHELVRRRIDELRGDLTIVTDLIDEARAIPRDAMIWGTHAARSRGFHAPGSDWRSLVPIADMANHGERVARFGFAASGDFEVHAATDLAAGQEIRHDYGRFPNARWLVGFGFALPDNPDDEVALTFAASERPVFVGAVADDRFRMAAILAGSPEEIVAAARRADALIARALAAPAGDVGWQRTCAIVRAGERAVLARIIEQADELFTRS